MSPSAIIFWFLSPLLNLLNRSIVSWACSGPPKHFWNSIMGSSSRRSRWLSWLLINLPFSPLCTLRRVSSRGDVLDNILRELVGCRVELFYADLRLYSIRIQNVLTAELYVNSVTTSGDRLLILGTGYIDSIGTGYSKNDKIRFIRCFSVLLCDFT